MTRRNAPPSGKDRKNGEATCAILNIGPIAETQSCDPQAFSTRQEANTD
jgi:hypothetical protein